MADTAREALFFATAKAFRDWIEANGTDATEVWVGFHKKRTGRPSVTWPEAVDQALCFGWIDGVPRGIDDERYRIHFTPRNAYLAPGAWLSVPLGNGPQQAYSGGNISPSIHSVTLRVSPPRRSSWMGPGSMPSRVHWLRVVRAAV